MIQNLSYYRIFYKVAKYGNISKAAKELYISQPAISKSIRKLEEGLETTLFIRSSKGVKLTEEGQVLFQHVESAFSILNSGEEKLHRNLELGVGHIRIGVSATLCKYMLLPYLSRFVKQNPHVRISIACQSSTDTLRMISENQIDLGFVGTQHVDKDILFQPVREIQDIFVASPEYLHNLEVRGVNPDEYLEKGTLMLLDKQNQSRKYIDANLGNYLNSSELIEISSMDLLIDFAKIGLGIAGVIRSFVENELETGELVQIRLPYELHPRPVGFAYKKSARFTDALQNFISMKLDG